MTGSEERFRALAALELMDRRRHRAELRYSTNDVELLAVEFAPGLMAVTGMVEGWRWA